MLLNFSVAIFVFLGLTIPSNAILKCELKWESEGYGNIPNYAIESGSNDFVARAFYNNEWIPGRMTPSKGKVYTTSGGAVIAFDTYEILTNPDNCILDWLNGYGGSIPDLSVGVDTNSPQNVYIGRAVVAGMTLGGKVVVDDSAIYLAYEDMEETRREYQVLTSRYPPLRGRLTNVQFVTTNLVNSNLRKELIGQEDIRNTYNAEIQHSIDHHKSIMERFTLTEDQEWNGIAQLFVTFPLWYGSSDVTEEFEVNGIELTVNRERAMGISRQINVKSGSVSQIQHLQVCTTVTIVEDERFIIPFTAIGSFTAEGMTTAQVTNIITGLNRTVIRTRGNEVEARISGNLTGRFATSVSSFSMVFNTTHFCNSAL